jgi:hypothetical protein
LNAATAALALEWYDEVVADAKARPGAHPNIDLLFEVVDQNLDLAIKIN